KKDFISSDEEQIWVFSSALHSEMAGVKKELRDKGAVVGASSCVRDRERVSSSSAAKEGRQRQPAKQHDVVVKANGAQQTAQSSCQSLDASLEEEVKAFLINEDELHTYDDLTKVSPVTPSTVLKCLQARYSAKVFYTHAGCTLVALNPFQPIPHLYSLDVMKEYHCAPQPQEFKPHIFIVAEEAYRNVQGQVEPTNQSLVVSGESGAGKYYATIAAPSSSQKCQDTVERIERRVLDSNPIMEAFGNASTLRNNNSSRFGKYIQLQLDRSQLLVGASVQTYLLEKTRVAFQAANERNFHIFYQASKWLTCRTLIHMMKGATEEQRLEWKMQCDRQFNWLPNADKTLEEDCFQETKHALEHLGIDVDVQGQIFRILAGLLNLGNVIFCPSDDESQPCKLKEQSRGFLQNTADLLGVPSEELEACLRLRSLRAGKQSVVLKPCSQAECSVRRDCLAKLIYAHVFDWLVACINKSMCADTSRWCNFIGLLDVYGFECFTSNNLEQLCINYANEKLQQHFVAHYLKAQQVRDERSGCRAFACFLTPPDPSRPLPLSSPQEDYVSEGLAWSFIQYQDNQSCLDLIEGSPAGVFSLLNEECRLNRPSDAKQFRMRLEKELSSNACVSWDKFSRQPDFTVLHYAGKVSYQIEGMMEKNKDPVPPELVYLLQQSQDSLLQSFFTEHSTEDSSGRGPSKVVTVVSKFKARTASSVLDRLSPSNSLESLMKILHSTTPHYTRCIKPNPDCRPLTFKKEEVINQLEACGIVETINISAAGFPIRIPYLCFLQRYGLIVNSKMFHRSRGENGLDVDKDTLLREVTRILNVVLRRHSLDPCGDAGGRTRSSMVHCGRTKVFMTQSMLELLEGQRDRERSSKAFSIQCCWRRHCWRKREARIHAATRIQAAVRLWLVRREVLRWRRAATVIQRCWRKWKVSEILESPFAVNYGNRGSVQLSTCQEPVMVRSWPLGLALASAPTITVAVTACGFQKVVSLMTCLKLSFRSTDYKVETNQFDQGVASIRAQPQWLHNFQALVCKLYKQGFLHCSLHDVRFALCPVHCEQQPPK
ncbi:unconventional myosin-XIX-like, partial [Scleropages formosus]